MSLLEWIIARPRAKRAERKQIHISAPEWNGWQTGGYLGSNASGLVSAGFRSNPVAYRALRMIAEACASIDLLVRTEADAIADDSSALLAQFLATPNRHMSGQEFREQLYLYLLAYGDSYVEAVKSDDHVEAYLLRPDCVSVVADNSGWPIAYEHRVGSQCRRIAQDDMAPSILHVKFFDPSNDYKGYGPLQAARGSIDMHNAATSWNLSLFANAARPSGALVYKGGDGRSHLTDEQFERLKRELEDNFQGLRNAGRPLLLEGGLDWSSISLSPQDMEFISAKHSAARDIALAFGVPPMLLGIPGDNTYANFAEANRAFWRQTIIPLTQRVTSALDRFLKPNHPNCRIACDLDHVPALADERKIMWERIGKADFLTETEKRQAVGYPAKDE